jgi:hypothetical protein
MKHDDMNCGVSSKPPIWTLFLIVLFIGVGSRTASGQVFSSVSGRVLDPTGSAVPDATVTVTSAETGAARVLQTDQAGNYRVLSLPVGPYEIQAEKTGFKVALRQGINLAVGQAAVVDLPLEVGAVAEQVTVTAEAPVVNTTTASISGLVGEKEVKELPLNGRSFDNLITLNPGAINFSSLKQTARESGTGQASYFTVAGRRPDENLFLLNGIEYTGSSNVGVTPGGVSGQLLGIDAVREFNVVSDAYGAEYGKRMGGQVNVITQSGTNQLHGSLFEFLRNDVLDARNFFDQDSIPAFRRNQFGGTLGGPIQESRMFLFGNYEGFRERLGLSSLAIVPDENARLGLLPTGPGGALVPVPNLNPAMLPFVNNLYPLPNGENLGSGFAESFSNPKQEIREDFGTARFDYNISDQDVFTGSYTVDDGFSLTPFDNPTFGTTANLRSQVVSAQETHIFSPEVINTVRAGFSRGAFSLASPPLVPLPEGLNFIVGQYTGPITVGSAIATQGGALTPGGGNVFGSTFNFRNLYSIADDVQVIRGKHQISFGVWFQQVQVNSISTARTNGQVSFATLQTFLQGTARTFSGVPTTTPLAWRSLEGAWYVQDTMQVTPNLSVRVGLRHEFTNGWNERTGRAAQFILGPDGVFLTEPRVAENALIENNATALFGPRVGFAWDPFGNGETSVRSGFGIYHSLLDNLAFPLRTAPPFNPLVSFENISLPSIIPINPATPLPPQCGPGVPQPCTIFQPFGIETNLKTPTVLAWNFSIEQQLSPSMSLRVAYLGSHGYRNTANTDYNTIPPQICSDAAGCTSGGIGTARGTVPQGAQYIPVGTRPNPYLSGGGIWTSQGISSYNALQLDVKKSFTHGLAFRTNYTYSRNFDNGSSPTGSQAQNQQSSLLDLRDPKRDYGRSALDFTHQASGNFSYELPFGRGKPFLSGLGGVADKVVGGWQVNGIVSLLSGFSFTPLVGSSRSGNGNTNSPPDRPNENPAFTGSNFIGSVDKWFDPTAFSLPTVGTFGNVGRGVMEGPGVATFDFSVFKNIPIRERMNLSFRAEFFNITDRTNLSLPNPTIFSGANISPSAGRITSTSTTSRQIQFGLKVIF